MTKFSPGYAASYAVMLTFLICGGAFAAPNNRSQNGQYYQQNDNMYAFKEIHDSLDAMRHEVNNHESEIRVFDEKLANLELIIEGVRDELNDSSKSQKDQLKGSYVNLEGRILSLETVTKGLVSDLKQFRTHANDSTSALVISNKKISELEKIIEQQNQNIEHLKVAMKSLMDALQIKESSSTKSGSDASDNGNDRTYRIKAGDSLEKIARSNGTTIQVLKELNGLVNDKIVVGKVLQLPEK